MPFPSFDLETLQRDARGAVRSLRARPLLSALIVLTIALGVGATTAIFSVVEGVLLRPLPFADPGRLVVVWEDLTREGNHRFSVAEPNYQDLRRRSTVFADVAAQFGVGVRIRVGGTPELARAARVTGNYFGLLGARAALGRTLGASDTLPANRRVVLLSDALWRRMFAGDAGVVGRTMTVDGEPYTIVGVMPATFAAPVFFKAPRQHAELWMPLDLPPGMVARDAAVLQLIARLRPGVSAAQANASSAAVARQLARLYPTTNEDVGFAVVPLERQLLGSFRTALLVLMGAAALLLLIAVANITNLYVARALTRYDEVRIRVALGARRLDLVRQFLTETLLAAAVGGGLGIALGWAGTKLLVAFAPHDAVRMDEVRVNGAVVLFSIALTLVVGLVAGLLPALHGSRADLAGGLSPARRALTASRGAAVARNALVVGQIALATVLAVGAGLMAKTVVGLMRVDPGFSVAPLLTMRFGMPSHGDTTATARLAYFRRLVDALERVPGVRSVAFTSRLPLDPAYGVASVRIDGRSFPPGALPVVGARVVSEGYFASMGIPLAAGREFDRRDDASRPGVVIVNRTMARRFWPNESGAAVVGRRIGFDDPAAPWLTIVGVAGDVSHDGIAAAPIAELYIPYGQSPENGGALVVRTAVDDPLALSLPIRRAAAAVDPDQAFIDVRTMREAATQSMELQRFSMLLLGAFAGFAVLLTAVGLYGVLAHLVAQRTREMGIRVALGAQPWQVLLLVARHGAAMAVAGVGLGVLATIASARFLASQLYGVAPTDLSTIAGAVAAIVLVAAVATVVPARRATRVDPAVALRAE